MRVWEVGVGEQSESVRMGGDCESGEGESVVCEYG